MIVVTLKILKKHILGTKNKTNEVKFAHGERFDCFLSVILQCKNEILLFKRNRRGKLLKLRLRENIVSFLEIIFTVENGTCKAVVLHLENQTCCF